MDSGGLRGGGVLSWSGVDRPGGGGRVPPGRTVGIEIRVGVRIVDRD